MNTLKFVFILCFVLVTARSGQSQDLSRHNWYFGNSTHAIRFDRTSNTAEEITKSLNQPFGIGGSAVATDHTNRNLLFYTDGASIYDVNGLVMPNGATLGGASITNQPVVVCPAPGVANNFFVFIRNAGGTVTSSTVDMNQFGNSLFPAPATGDVSLRNQPVGSGLTNRSEAMLLIAEPSNTAYWLITHEQNSNNYTVTSISAITGITNTVVPGLGFDLNAANFSYHAGTGQIAVSPSDGNTNIALLNFDNVTGALTFNQFLFNTSVNASTEPSVYDIEWSMSGRFLYISRTGEAGIPAALLQYDLNNPTSTLTEIPGLASGLARSWGLEMAPDSSIYHVYQSALGGPFLVGKLSEPDSIASATVYTQQAFGALDFGGKQFPAFAPKPRITLSLSFIEEGLCSGTNTNFFPSVAPGADSLIWSFGDGSNSTSWSPAHQYQNGGSFNVILRAFLKGDTASFTKSITVTQFDLTLSLVQDTTACKCELPINNSLPECNNDTSDDFSIDVQIQGGTPSSIQWFGPGGILLTQTSATLRPDSAGFYYVVVTDATGCSAYAGVTIKEYGLQEQQANIWYFGNQAGIDFNEGTRAITNPVMNAPEGCAIICDQNGQTIFFTDGNRVWDRAFIELTNSIGGELNSTQSSFIIPVQGDPTLYYIFTTQEIFGSGLFELRYSLYDLKANNGVGDVVQQNIPLFSKSTERITGNDNWLIAHEFGNNSFRAYNISAQGIGSPVISSIGSDHLLTVRANGEGYMKLGGRNMLAVALSSPGTSNAVELFDFDNNTGVVSNYRSASLNNLSGQVYGVEFSPAGNKLFATLSGASSQLVEFAIDSVGIPYLKNPPFPSVPNRLGAIQTGPDGRVYVAVDGQAFLGTVLPVEDTTQVSSFILNGFPLLGGTTSRLGLPNFAQSISTPSQQPTISVNGLCLGTPTVFLGSGTDRIDELTWFFGDGTSATGDSTSHTYAAAGTYLVTLQITNRCGLDTTITRSITIVAPPANPTFLPPGLVPVLCTSSLLLEATPASNPNLSNLSFLWSNGATTRTVTITEQQIISVTISDVNGCAASGSILVADNRPIVTLPPDQTICQNTPLPPLDANNPGLTITWTVNNLNPSSTQTRSVVTSSPGTFDYEVTVFDPITLCEVQDNVIFTINPTPVFTAVGTNATSCLANNGSILLSIPFVGGSFSSFFTGPPASQNLNQPGPVNETFTNLASGSYGITIRDDLTGCQANTIVGIANPTIVLVATQNGICEPLSISVNHNLVGAFTYRVLNSTNTLADSGPPASGFDPFITNNLAANDSYVVELSQGGCTSSSLPVTLTPAASITIDGFNSVCDPTSSARTISVVTTPLASNFTWQAIPTSLPAGSGIIGSSTSPTINLASGTYDVTVIVDDGPGGLCPTAGTFATIGADPFISTLIQTDPCQDQVNLLASPIGSFTYLWTENGSNVVAGQQLALTTAQDNFVYTVTVRSTISGCLNLAPTLQANVVGEFSVLLTSTPPCEGSPFTLTASATQTPDNISWTLNNTPIAGASTSSITDTRAGEYKVNVTRDVCLADNTTLISIAPRTNGQLPDNLLICNDPANSNPDTKQVELNPGPGFKSFAWFKEEISLNDFSPIYIATEPGFYSVDLINVFDCSSSDATTIALECDPRIVAPTAFRPGSVSELTKDFFVYRFFVADEDFQIFIYNRWGEMIFQANDPNFKWNGGYNNGAQLPAGTYTYVVKFKSSFRPEDGVLEQRGGIVLIR